jgi:alkylation response protein AidB-like acyl-CoA dehydrogenase
MIAKDYGFEQRKACAAQPHGWSRAMWAKYAEMGLLALPFDARHGGLGCGPVELMLVMEALGRGLVLEPYFETVVLAGGVLRAAEEAGQHNDAADDLVARIATGGAVVAFAHAERQSRYNLADIATTAARDGSSFVLDGLKTVVRHADCADLLIVSARVAGDRAEPGGLALFLVEADSPGVTRKSYATHDGVRAADVRLSGVRVAAQDVIGVPGRALPLIERAADLAIAALAAEAVGAMSAALDITVEYLKLRHQFGGPIGRFQALQHRAAEMLIALEQARSMAMFAALMVDDPDVAERRKALSAVKVQIGKSGRFIGQQAVQLHGGIGVTQEYAVGHYFKRLTMIELQGGDSMSHLARVARAGGFVATC